MNWPIIAIVSLVLATALRSDAFAQRGLTWEELRKPYDVKPPPGYVPPAKPRAPALPAPAEAVDPGMLEILFSDARQAILATLKDPDSAKFGRLYPGSGITGAQIICGAVNAKNSYGGYNGMTGFVYFIRERHVELITTPVNNGMTSRGIQAYHSDCLRQPSTPTITPRNGAGSI